MLPSQHRRLDELACSAPCPPYCLNMWGVKLVDEDTVVGIFSLPWKASSVHQAFPCASSSVYLNTKGHPKKSKKYKANVSNVRHTWMMPSLFSSHPSLIYMIPSLYEFCNQQIHISSSGKQTSQLWFSRARNGWQIIFVFSPTAS
jgi:hypothetical protein